MDVVLLIKEVKEKSWVLLVLTGLFSVIKWAHSIIFKSCEAYSIQHGPPRDTIYFLYFTLLHIDQPKSVLQIILQTNLAEMEPY